jgi:hypothetical protein
LLKGGRGPGLRADTPSSSINNCSNNSKLSTDLKEDSDLDTSVGVVVGAAKSNEIDLKKNISITTISSKRVTISMKRCVKLLE